MSAAHCRRLKPGRLSSPQPVEGDYNHLLRNCWAQAARRVEARRSEGCPVANQQPSFGLRSPKMMTSPNHLTMKQLPPPPFSRSQSVAASALDRPKTRSR